MDAATKRRRLPGTRPGRGRNIVRELRVELHGIGFGRKLRVEQATVFISLPLLAF